MNAFGGKIGPGQICFSASNTGACNVSIYLNVSRLEHTPTHTEKKADEPL